MFASFKKLWTFFNISAVQEDESWYVIRMCLAIIAIGTILSLSIMAITFFKEGVYKKDFCLSNSCFDMLYDYYSVSFKLLVLSFKASLGLFALGTFGVACKTYANNKNANAFSSHISYLSLFQNYVGFEISKRISVDRNSADVLNWYNVIFPSSNVGDLRVSSNYITILREIDDCIKKSNEEFVGPAYKHFDYNVHQRRIIEILKRIGIELEPLPRSNFWSVEEEVLSLIEVVNASFFKLDDYNKFTKSNYR